MKSERAFWFPINPQALLSDCLVDSMTTLEFGASMRLLCRQWIDGFLPVEKEQLRRLSRLTPIEIDSCFEVLSKFFPLSTDGTFRANVFAYNKRLEVTKQMQIRHTQAICANQIRWGNRENSSIDVSNDDPVRTPVRTPIIKIKSNQNKTKIKTSIQIEDFSDIDALFPNAMQNGE